MEILLLSSTIILIFLLAIIVIRDINNFPTIYYVDEITRTMVGYSKTRRLYRSKKKRDKKYEELKRYLGDFPEVSITKGLFIEGLPYSDAEYDS